MRDKIVGLHGRAAPLSNGAEPDVIGGLESLLNQARKGEIVAFAIAVIRPNLEVGTISRGSGKRHLLLAGATYLMHDLAEEGGDG